MGGRRRRGGCQRVAAPSKLRNQQAPRLGSCDLLHWNPHTPHQTAEQSMTWCTTHTCGNAEPNLLRGCSIPGISRNSRALRMIQDGLYSVPASLRKKK